jgi:hypothetical protein
MSDTPELQTTIEGVADAIKELIRGVGDPDVTLGIETDGYGKCVEAMWRAAYVAHEYVARELGVTGFQHSVSSLRVLGALRGYEGPYMVIDASNALYPQYDLLGQVTEFLGSESTGKWLAEAAQKKLNEDSGYANGRVVDHWWELVRAGES